MLKINGDRSVFRWTAPDEKSMKWRSEGSLGRKIGLNYVEDMKIGSNYEDNDMVDKLVVKTIMATI